MMSKLKVTDNCRPGFVIIGRNEGDRLKQCLKSVTAYASPVVYVDSGSTDGSVEYARTLGVQVVELDLSIPFTAARARNAGFSRLIDLYPALNYVQFVDGDCEVVSGWVENAQNFLDSDDTVAVVCGRRRERYPEKTIYNFLCDIEWDTPVGEAMACGGDAMMRVNVLQQVNGFRDDLIAGEEPELCVRIRQAGFRIWRLDQEMTLHDAAMTKFSQWWQRSKRAGYAFALGASIHGNLPERHWVKETRRAQIWTAGVLIPTFLFVLLFGYSGLLILGIYPLQVVRLALKSELQGVRNWQWAFYTVLGKFPEIVGQFTLFKNRMFRNRETLIEYKQG